MILQALFALHTQLSLKFAMHFTICLLSLIGLLPVLHCSYDVIAPAQNLTAYMLARQKRQLIFPRGSSIRLLLVPVSAIQLDDPYKWRSFVAFVVVHLGGYNLPSAPLYPWDKWDSVFSRSLKEKIRQLDESHEDDTRLFAYAALEHYMDNASSIPGRGRQCLLRAMCENAQVHHHVGIIAELLNLLLTPGKARLDQHYKEAHAAGLAGVDCLHQFHGCPRGASVLDELTVDVNY
ncbi:uncharacterized protein LOC6583429 [Drosophila mojavensis]|uniref:Uncharacterized protein n=1 Tax=Drosophila mojavensis TaxID=7230 RepID=B4KW22_DROMO|nr:uncharacterized protein LOC6583429 [Drosophila mojavensis]EDW19573.2 uncharacterized protein Dmoj_GI11450 [Drosophila mojavensis]